MSIIQNSATLYRSKRKKTFVSHPERIEWPINNLNPSVMAEVFVINVVPYSRGSTNFVLLGQTCMALILQGLLLRNYGRICRKKSVPNIRDF